MNDFGYDVKIELKAVSSHDLEKILKWYHDDDYWNSECSVEIETISFEEEEAEK